MKIKGKVVYKKIGTGCWGIEGSDGQNYRPINFPESWKVEGKSVELTAEEASESMSVFMWGKAIRIKNS